MYSFVTKVREYSFTSFKSTKATGIYKIQLEGLCTGKDYSRY